MREKVPLGQDTCCYCQQPIDPDEIRVGAGDGSRTGADGCFAHQVCYLRQEIEQLEVANQKLQYELNAYKKAKAENDERFQIECSGAQNEVRRLRIALAEKTQENDLNVEYMNLLAEGRKEADSKWAEFERECERLDALRVQAMHCCERAIAENAFMWSDSHLSEYTEAERRRAEGASLFAWKLYDLLGGTK